MVTIKTGDRVKILIQGSKYANQIGVVTHEPGEFTKRKNSYRLYFPNLKDEAFLTRNKGSDVSDIIEKIEFLDRNLFEI